MARQGDIYLGGVEGSPTSGQVYNSGVGFSLTAPSPFSDVYSFEDGKWEVEIHRDQAAVVARSLEILPLDMILNEGYEACQKYLDLVSVAKQRYMEVEDPEESYALLFKEREQWVLRVVALAGLSAEFSASSTQTILNGEVVSPPPKPRLEWIPAFRYYRLSRMSHDLYEAYRNLFLSFESLLYETTPPISPRERETDWLRRALKKINTAIPLADYVPGGTQDPVNYFLKRQYETRCDLFHAKKGRSILPHADLNLQNLADAYAQLFLLWQQIAVRYFNTSRNGVSFNYHGFRLLMDDAFGDGFELLATDDPTPVSKSDTDVSPLNHPVIPFSHLRYENASVPGRVFLIGCLEGEALRNMEMFHRFCSKTRGVLFTMSDIKEGLFPVGVDKLECYHGIRLKNNNLPK